MLTVYCHWSNNNSSFTISIEQITTKQPLTCPAWQSRCSNRTLRASESSKAGTSNTASRTRCTSETQLSLYARLTSLTGSSSKSRNASWTGLTTCSGITSWARQTGASYQSRTTNNSSRANITPGTWRPCTT